jgi:hypothetical protein
MIGKTKGIGPKDKNNNKIIYMYIYLFIFEFLNKVIQIFQISWNTLKT